ncbi:MAG TPA: L,D-transpeptidase family protein [Novosphingobium sp.]|nr:L,D-transpeptidase family protein [Novosphingobium sp.]
MKTILRLALAVIALTAVAPVAAAPTGDEPIAVPRTIRQGIDFVYVDPDMSTVAKRRQRPRNWLTSMFNGSGKSAANPLFARLADGLETYQASWGRLPHVKVRSGPPLKLGATGGRVRMLRQRLGLPPGAGYDETVFQRVMEYQSVHGIGTPDGVAGKATIASLNLGPVHYARRIAINMERAHRLPATNVFSRYVVVDSGAAEIYLFNRDRVTDQMRVIVGSPKSKTPMMAVLMRTAKANPYWNVPPDLIASMTAKRVLQQGPSYLNKFHYEVLSDWTHNARRIDPKSVNWRKVAGGKADIRVRQLPGPWNSMGAMKFEMPNDYGIYLHDTPNKDLLGQQDRWLSNGCVRLEDFRRFASWVFPRTPQTTLQAEQSFELPQPVPIYMTYLTVEAGSGGVIFRPDRYGFDELAAPEMFGRSSKVARLQ